jgi:hypothetical protein
VVDTSTAVVGVRLGVAEVVGELVVGVVDAVLEAGAFAAVAAGGNAAPAPGEACPVELNISARTNAPMLAVPVTAANSLALALPTRRPSSSPDFAATM